MKTALLTIIAILATASLTMAGMTSWNFDDGTAQGWYSSAAGTLSIDGTPGSYYLTVTGDAFTFATNQPMVDLSYVVGAGDYLKFDYKAADYTALSVVVVTESLSAYAIPQVYEWSLNNQIPFSSFGVNPGDTITKLGFYAYAPGYYGTRAISIDNIAIVPVPEPASLGLLALSGLAMLLRRRR